MCWASRWRATRVLYEEPDPGFRVGVALSQSEKLIFFVTGDHVTAEIRFVPADAPFAPPVLDRAAPHRHPLRRGPRRRRALSPGRRYAPQLSRVVRTEVAHARPRALAGGDRRQRPPLYPLGDALRPLPRHRGADRRARPDPAADGGRVGTAHPFPEAAYEAGLGANPSPDPSVLRLEYSSLVRPATTYAYDVATGAMDVLKVQEIPSGL